MLDDVPQLDEIDDVLDALSSPDSLEVYEDVLPYDDTMLIAAAIRIAVNAAGGGGGGGSPTGAAGGVLGGTYPNPSFAADMATQVELDAHVNDTSAAHAASAVSADSTTLVGTGTTVQAVLEELDDAVAAAQPLDSDLTAIAALTTTSFGRGLLELANQASLLSAAGAAAAVHAHSGADITSGTVAEARIDSAIARDSEVTSAISALSTVYQPLDSDLTAVAALTTTSFGRAFLALADAAATRTALGLVIGADVQAFDQTLTALAAADWAANSVPVGTGANTLSQTTMGASTILARLAAGNIVAATPAELRTLLALVVGTNVEAWDADLDAIAGLSPSNDDLVQRKAGAWTNRTIAQLLADLAAAGTTFQPLDSDLTSIAALTTTATGRSVLAAADAAAIRAIDASAPVAAKYIVQTADSELSAEQALSALATGLVKNTTTTGVLSIGAEGTDYWKPGGTDVALADGGTGASLVDPNADRILFWDDSAGSVAFLAPGSGLTITTTTIDASAPAPSPGSWIYGFDAAHASGDEYVPPLGSGQSFFSAGRGNLSPAVFTQSKTIKLGVNVSSGTATAVVRLVIVAADGTKGIPGTILADLGTIDGSTTGIKYATGTYAVTAGTRYYVGAIGQVAVCSVIQFANVADWCVPVTSGAYGTTAYRYTGLTGALSGSIGAPAAVETPGYALYAKVA